MISLTRQIDVEVFPLLLRSENEESEILLNVTPWTVYLVWHILTLFGSGIVHVLNGLKNGTTQLLQQRL